MDETGEQDKRQPGVAQPPGASPHPRPSPFAKSSEKPGMPHHWVGNPNPHPTPLPVLNPRVQSWAASCRCVLA